MAGGDRWHLRQAREVMRALQPGHRQGIARSGAKSLEDGCDVLSQHAAAINPCAILVIVPSPTPTRSAIRR